MTKVLLQCPRLQTLKITGCSRLAVLMLWSDELQQLDLTGVRADCGRQGSCLLSSHSQA